jgi:hypothetical protein
MRAEGWRRIAGIASIFEVLNAGCCALNAYSTISPIFLRL